MRYRIIYFLCIELEQPPEAPPGSSSALIVPLNRSGMPQGTRGRGNGRPRPPKVRTIDLRPGDQILCEGTWRTVKEITAYRDNWLTGAQAAARSSDDGYLYRVAGSADDIQTA